MRSVNYVLPDYQAGLSLCNIGKLTVVKLYITTHDEKAKYFKDTGPAPGGYRHLFGLFGPEAQAGVT